MTTGNLVLPSSDPVGLAQESTALNILAAVDNVENKLDTLDATATGIAAGLTLLATEATATGIAAGVALVYATATGIADTMTTLATEATATGMAATLGDIYATATGIAAEDFATEATLEKIRKWPYATHAKIQPSEDATNTYYTYKTGADATVGTITINKTTGLITYSPDKVA